MDIDRIAKLAKIALSEEEKADFETSLPSILDYVGKLEEVDTSKVEAKAYLTDSVNAFRADEIEESAEERQGVIDNFPSESGGALQVPAVFE
ncbi:MAG: Asp-tRNA(Asn)/Glu-tRNA(Gln) amidotransferase subunit GatC [bacterium]|nr:Asp-tRNA(Asn)/Glu-tRNA(Gln) amidotransferase subunit GatC [bacterium]MDA1024734.1 Asp-tRNA(Asn)/Glu-tRNA(Gln) amidotransferase subunit GatC [bacterium]